MGVKALNGKVSNQRQNVYLNKYILFAGPSMSAKLNAARAGGMGTDNPSASTSPKRSISPPNSQNNSRYPNQSSAFSIPFLSGMLNNARDTLFTNQNATNACNQLKNALAETLAPTDGSYLPKMPSPFGAHALDSKFSLPLHLLCQSQPTDCQSLQRDFQKDDSPQSQVHSPPSSPDGKPPRPTTFTASSEKIPLLSHE